MALLIFDLDGTLIDSQRDLVCAVNATRLHMGMEELPEATIRGYVGNGAPTLVRRSLGAAASDADVDRGLEYFLSYYWDHVLDYTVLYPGVRESIDHFLHQGVPMAVLTNKPIRFTNAIIDGLGLRQHFFRVYGGNSFEQKKPDPVGIEALLAECPAPRGQTWMIGDSAIDIRTARNAGVRACGVTYGFQPETLTADPPDLLFDDLRLFVPHVLGEGTQP